MVLVMPWACQNALASDAGPCALFGGHQEGQHLPLHWDPPMLDVGWYMPATAMRDDAAKKPLACESATTTIVLEGHYVSSQGLEAWCCARALRDQRSRLVCATGCYEQFPHRADTRNRARRDARRAPRSRAAE